MSKNNKPMPTVESIMAILRETAENLRVLSTDLKELRESQRQTDEQIKELKESQRQTDEQIKQTDEYIKNLSKEASEQIKNLGTEVGSIGNQWGKIAEYLVGSDFKSILKEQFGIVTDFSARNFDGNYQGEYWEVDIAAANGDIAVVGEVKVTMTVEKVEAFVNKNLRNFHLYMPDHRHKKIYGLIAFIKIDDGYEDEVLSRARKYGLLVVKAMGDTFKVLTPAGTELHDYGVAGKTNN